LIAGTEVFVTTDNSDINSTTYGTTGNQTGAAYGVDTALGSPSLTLLTTLRGGASSLVLARSNQTLIGGASDRTQQLAQTATTTGTSVDYLGNKKATRLLWLRAQK